MPGAGTQPGDGTVSRTERGERWAGREGAEGRGSCYRLRTCGKLRQRRRREPRAAARGTRRPKRDALREPPALELPEAQAAVRIAAEGWSITGRAAAELLRFPRSRSAVPAGGWGGRTDRQVRGLLCEYGLFKDGAQPTDAALPIQSLEGFYKLRFCCQGAFGDIIEVRCWERPKQSAAVAAQRRIPGTA